MNAIQIEELSFAYGGAPDVLTNLNMTVGAGEKVFLFGPSGSGKTTLLSLVTGILRSQRGSVTVLGEHMNSLGASQRDELRGSRIGYIFQMFNLLPYLTAFENILLPCRMNSLRRARIESPEKEAEDLLKRLGIEALRDALPYKMSVGQQQRVAAARALLGSPDLVIADEPTSALDSDFRERFLELLFENTDRSNAAVLFVSHDRSLAPLFDRKLSLPDINSAYRSPEALPASPSKPPKPRTARKSR